MMKTTMLVEETFTCEEGVKRLQLPLSDKSKGNNLRYRASPATRTICAFSMLALVCLGGAVMHYTIDNRRRLSNDYLASKIECNNYLDRIPVLAVILYGLCLIVLFIGLANITDDFFVPALSVTGKRLKLSEDVTGATLMASGSSAPELFTSGVDAFLHGSSIGIGTVVGSAVFNILVIIACSGAWATESLIIDWKPFSRDCTFYCLSILLLVYMLEWDGDKVGRIWWWEGLIMFLCYGCYVLIMAYNQTLMSCLSRCFEENKEEIDVENEPHLMVQRKVVEVKCMLPKPACSKSEIDERENGKQMACYSVFRWFEVFSDFFSDGWAVVFKHIPNVNTEDLEEELETCPDNEDLLSDIRKKQKGYQCTFFLSIMWIGVICIFMVELAERIGCLIGIKPLFMGLTVLAAGTSVPDALGSIASATRGMGDMAVANAIGSNVFDILIGLGLPWFLRGVILNEEYLVEVDDLIIFIGILFATIFITLFAFIISRWKLGPTLGKIPLAAYFSFLVFAVMYVYVLE